MFSRSHRSALGFALFAAFTLLLAMDRPASAVEYTYTKIVDSADGVFFSNGFDIPAINNLGQVAFKATDSNLSNGVFRGSGGALTTIATDTTGSIAFINNPVSINDAGVVSFTGNIAGFEEAVLAGSGGPVISIADATGDFGAFHPSTSINNTGSVAFQAQVDTTFDEGLFHGSGGAVTTVFNTASSSFAGSFAGPSINNAGQIAFHASNDDGTDGIYRYNPVSGTFTTIIHNDNAGSIALIDDTPSINSSGIVAVHVDVDSFFDEGIYLGDGTTLTPVVTRSGSGFLFLGVPSLNDSGNLAFIATLDGSAQQGLFDGIDPVNDLVLRAFDTFDGRLIVNITLGREGLNDRGELAFRLDFGDGSSAIYRATPVPEPTTTLAAATIAMSAAMSRRRR